MMSNEQYRLHPISAVISFIKRIKELIIPIIIVLVSSFFTGSEKVDFWEIIVPILIIGIPAILLLISGIIDWLTFRYWFEDGELRVKYGLFVKKKRFIPFERIQSFNHKEGIFHRLFGLVEVTVETAGGAKGSPEVVLTAIKKEEAKRVEAETRKVKVQNSKELCEQGNCTVEGMEEVKLSSSVIHKMSTKDLIVLATTSNSIGVVITGILAVYSQVSEYIPTDYIFDELQSLLKYGFIFITFLVFIAFLIAWIISVIITLINYYNFTVIEENDRLIVTRGLIEKKRVTIPLKRVQAIKIVENPFRQIFGLATVIVETAGGGIGEKDLRMALFPVVSKKEMYGPLKKLFPQYDLKTDIIKPSIKGRPFFYRKDFLWIVPAIVICSYYFYPYGLLSTLGIIPLMLIRFWQYKTTGVAISDNQLVIVYRLINRVTFFAEKKRIQAIETRQSYFQRRKNVSSVEATVMSDLAGTTARASHLDEVIVDDVMKWFERT